MSTIFPAAPAALIVAHPGHEIRLHGWLELARPRVFILTDGSGRASHSRLGATTAYLSEYGVEPSGLYGRFTDREVYLALLARNYSFFLRLADELADSFLREGIGYVSGDAAEGYNSTHDTCRLLINTAVEMAGRAGTGSIRNFDFPVVNRPDYCPAGERARMIRLELDGEQFRRKISSARKYYPELAAEVEQTYAGGERGTLDDYLARDEGELREHARGVGHVSRRVFASRHGGRRRGRGLPVPAAVLRDARRATRGGGALRRSDSLPRTSAAPVRRLARARREVRLTGAGGGPPLRVLITNHSLSNYAGTELYVRDLATRLLGLGHAPVVYSTQLGRVADDLRAATVPVTDDLNSLALAPDLIHGQHNLETMTALLHFPDAPAAYFCHGWLARVESPPRFPRILRYVAVDDTCYDRLICEEAIPVERARVILNFVDLTRFRPRPPLPAKPARALVFSNYASEDSYLGAVREACRRAGITLDVAGLKAGHVSAQPERLLGHYDLVFAKARCALEALAVGAAVVLCDRAGAGALVTTGELEALRRLNFGVRALRDELTADTLARQIARYDARDAAEVSRRVRATVGIEAAVDEIVALYREVVDEHAADTAAGGTRDGAAEGRAAAAYLRWLCVGRRAEREAVDHSTTARLQARVLGLPIVGRLARAVARRAAGNPDG
jgi:hypothetical protein